MTSKEIQSKPNGAVGDTDAGMGVWIPFWLKEIAYQLAVVNEKEALVAIPAPSAAPAKLAIHCHDCHTFVCWVPQDVTQTFGIICASCNAIQKVFIGPVKDPQKPQQTP